MHDTKVSQQVMKHNFLTTVICAWHVGQTLQAKLNQPDFQCLLMSIQRSARTCEIRQKSITFIEKRVSGLFSSFLVNEKPVLLCMIMYCIPASRSFSHQDVNFNSKFPSAVQLLLILIAAIMPVPDSAAIRCIFPISHGHSVEFNLPNAWYLCIPSR